jgi:hypothetical protein
MTNEVARLYAVVAGVATFLVAWAAVAARPWNPRPAQDPRVAAIAARQARLHRESIRVKALVDARWRVYRSALAARHTHAPAARPSVRVVTLPPLVVTRPS